MARAPFIVIGLLMVASSTFAATTTTPASRASTTPAGFTNREFVRARHEFNRRTLRRPYHDHGKRDAKWDADVEQFLEGMAIRFANAGMATTYHLPNEPDSETLLRWARSAKDKGCDDPMLLYCYAAVLHDSGQTAAARPLLASAAKQVMTSPYPLNRAANAARRFANVTDDAEQREDAWKKFSQCVLAMVTTWRFEGIDRRILFEQIMPISEMPRERRDELIDGIRQQPAADPWLANMIEGQYHYMLAWEARGNGVAGTVTRERWEVFHAELGKARDNCLAAHKLSPGYPDAATAMVSVAVAGEFDDDVHTWFKRATAAQIDHLLAYDAYINVLLPRWGGSTNAMYDYAVACLDTGRFDTIVPFQFVSTVEKIAWDLGTPEVWKHPGVYENVARMCDGYVAYGQTPTLVNFYKSLQAAATWRAGHFADARKLLQELGDNADEGAFQRMRALGKLALSHAFVMGGDAARDVEAAERDVASDRIDQAIASYRTLAAAAKDRSAFFLKSRLKQLEWQKQFATSDWVSLQPDDPELTGWCATSAKYERDSGGALIARVEPGASADITMQGVFFGPRYQIEATIEFPEGDSASAGITAAQNDPFGTCGVHAIWVAHGPGDRSVISDNWNNQEFNVPRSKTTVLRLNVWDDGIFIFVNDKLSLRKPDMRGQMTGRVYLGLFARSDPPENPVRFTTVRIRKLTGEPEGSR